MVNRKCTNEEIKRVCKQSKSMGIAMMTLQLPYQTLKRKALLLGVWKPNQGGKGIKDGQKWTNEQVFMNPSPHTSSFVRIRLYKCELKKEKCEECGIRKWHNKKIVLELHHIDGNKYNNVIENLQILCPNCHSQTPTFRNSKRL